MTVIVDTFRARTSKVQICSCGGGVRQAPYGRILNSSINRNLIVEGRYRVTPIGGKTIARVRNELSAATRREIGI